MQGKGTTIEEIQAGMDFYYSGAYYLYQLRHGILQSNAEYITALCFINMFFNRSEVAMYDASDMSGEIMGTDIFQGFYKKMKSYIPTMFVDWSSDKVNGEPLLDVLDTELFLKMLLTQGIQESLQYVKNQQNAENISRYDNMIRKTQGAISKLFEANEEHLAGLLIEFLTDPSSVQFPEGVNISQFRVLLNQLNEIFLQSFSADFEKRVYRKMLSPKFGKDFVSSFNSVLNLNTIFRPDLFPEEKYAEKFKSYLLEKQDFFINTPTNVDTIVSHMIDRDIDIRTRSFKAENLHLSVEEIRRLGFKKYKMTDDAYLEIAKKYEAKFIKSEVSKVTLAYEKIVKEGLQVTPNNEIEASRVGEILQAIEYGYIDPKKIIEAPGMYDENNNVVFKIKGQSTLDRYFVSPQEYLSLISWLESETTEALPEGKKERIEKQETAIVSTESTKGTIKREKGLQEVAEESSDKKVGSQLLSTLLIGGVSYLVLGE